jgi:hypothetical protein
VKDDHYGPAIGSDYSDSNNDDHLVLVIGSLVFCALILAAVVGAASWALGIPFMAVVLFGAAFAPPAAIAVGLLYCLWVFLRTTMRSIREDRAP